MLVNGDPRSNDKSGLSVCFFVCLNLYLIVCLSTSFPGITTFQRKSPGNEIVCLSIYFEERLLKYVAV